MLGWRSMLLLLGISELAEPQEPCQYLDLALTGQLLDVSRSVNGS